MAITSTTQAVQDEVAELKDKIREYEETLNAIRSGEVDALVVAGKKGEQIYTLKGAEHPYRAFIEHMNEGAVTLSPEGAILYCNPRFGALMRQPVQTLIGRSVLDMATSPYDRKILKGLLAAGIGENNQAEVTFRSSDNDFFPAKISVSGLSIEEAPAFSMVVMDLTERRQKEEFRALAENSPDIIVRVTRELRVVYANPAAAAVYGSAVAGKTVSEVSGNPGETAVWQKLSRFVFETAQSAQYEFQHVSPKGNKRFFDARVIPELNEKGQVISSLTIARDVTERKTAEDTLRRNEYELRTLVDNSPDIIFRLNRQLQYVYVNPAYERVTGLAKEQFIGKTNSQLGMSQQMVEFWYSSIQPVLASGRERSVEFEMTSFFGTRYFFARLIPEFEKSGLVETVLVIARDISERKKAEEQIRYVSFHDEVTGLFNRAYFEEEIRRMDTERNLPISIVMGDVNNLKLMNDVFGHYEGDRLLKTIADTLRKACRQSDIVSRWGGDEFVVILPETDNVTAEGICSRIGDIAAENKDTVMRPSIALGVATKGHGDQNIYQVIRQAEQRMYDYKIAHAVENQDVVLSSLLKYTRGKAVGYDAHIGRSSELARCFGEELGLSEDQQKDLRMLIELHDIGKAVIPQDILTKPGRLNGDEWNTVKKHPEVGFRVVKSFPDTARISDEVLSHAEYWDGSGYPRGLRHKEIPWLARVFLIIDAFDVMTHPRPYARAFTREEAMQELCRSAGKQFEPELVERFKAILARQEVPG